MGVGVSNPTCVSATKDPSGRRVCPTTSEMLTTGTTSSYDRLSRLRRTDTENRLRPVRTTVVVPAEVEGVAAAVEMTVGQTAVEA